MTKNIEFTERGILLPPHIVDDLTRREFLIGAGLIALAPGCGSEEGNGGESSGETRTVEHELGTTEVPRDPGRVVVLDTTPAEAALAVSIEPVGAPLLGEELPRHLVSRLEGAEAVGQIGDPNLETIAALDPDVILCLLAAHEDVYDELSEISPTVAVNPAYPDWKADMLLAARALGREVEMEREISAFEERVAGFKEEMGERLDEVTVSLVNRSGDVFIYLPGSFMGQVVEEAGLKRPEAQLDLVTEDNDFYAQISNEEVSLVEADVIFTTRDPESDTSFFERMREEGNPLYTRLEAVQNDRVYEVPYDPWLAGRGVISANLILDDLEEFLLEGDPD